MDSLKDIYRSAVSLLKGMKVTAINAARRPVTLQYPDERPVLPTGYRGIPALLSDEGGKARCTACGICARTCPLGVIKIDSELGPDKKRILKDYSLEASRCMVCNLCVEACPFDSLVMAKDFELADYDPDRLVYHKDRLLEFGRPYKHGNPFYKEPDPKPAAKAGTPTTGGEPA
ncbi:MAG TPA: NADH-quinone oxidoreductase subunit I [Bacillota bacterium]|jgi:NADH-quinone oxidoreductase subunit I